jgi:hypothetical protein
MYSHGLRSRSVVAVAIMIGLAVIAPVCNSQERNPSPRVSGHRAIRGNDTLEIWIQNEPDLSGWVSVRADGTFSFPLVGIVPAAGLSVSQLGHSLAERLKLYLRSPKVVVEMGAGAENERGHRRKWLSPPSRPQPSNVPPLWPSSSLEIPTSLCLHSRTTECKHSSRFVGLSGLDT